jgi:hypothetical protein
MMKETTVVTVVQPTGPTPHQTNKDSSLAWIQFNTNYFKAIPGILKLVQLVGFYCTVVVVDCLA